MEADNHTGCLVLFQQGEVAAITGDDTVLAGLAAQDPYAVVPDQRAFTAEPYGLGITGEERRLRPFRQRPAGPDAQQRRVDHDLQPLAGRLTRTGPQPAQGGLRQDIVTSLQAHHPAQQPCERGRRAQRGGLVSLSAAAGPVTAPAAPGRMGSRCSRPRP